MVLRSGIILAVVALSLLLSPLPVPHKAVAAVEAGCDGSTSFLGFPTWYKYLDVGGPNCDIIGPLQPETGNIDWGQAGGRVGLAVIEIMLRVAALVAVGFTMYGGFRYILSQGDVESAKSARNTIINGVVGLVISMIATGVVLFIASRLS